MDKPTVSLSGTRVIIRWTSATSNGADITAYTVEYDNSGYTSANSLCIETAEVLLSTGTCSIEMSSILASPLAAGTAITAKVKA